MADQNLRSKRQFDLGPRRSNEKLQNRPAQNRFLSAKRSRIEDVFHEIEIVWRNIERWLAKTVFSLATRIIAKVTSQILQHLPQIDFGVKGQIFESPAAS